MNSEKKPVSLAVIRRLPRYYRYLADLERAGTTKISSKELAALMDLTASQIRQDLNYFGGFGQQGYGYNVSGLKTEIASILGINQSRGMIQLGAGNLGRAIASHIDFATSGFDLLAIFEVDPKLVGSHLGGHQILHVDEIEAFCRQQHPIAVSLCIPEEAAEDLVPRLIACGIKSFLNFTHYDIGIHYDNISVENVYIGDSLMTLAYKTAALEQ